MTVSSSSTRRVFISYSWDSDDHQEWVFNLASRLTVNGIDVIYDQWNTRLGSDLAAFMETGITGADRVLVVSSADYVRKANESRGGAGYEKRIMTAEILADLTSNKVVPVIRNNAASSLLPTFLSGTKYVDFRDDAQFETKYAELIHDLYGRQLRPRPALGPSPFADSDDPLEKPSRSIAPTPVPAAPTLWQPLAAPIQPLWRSEVFSRESGYFTPNTLVEVELVPTESQHVEVRRLQRLVNNLSSVGRDSGLFSGTQGLESDSSTSVAWVRVQNDHARNENGLLVTRAGQRGFWTTLPRDGLGTILDEGHLTGQIASGLRALSRITIDTPVRYAVGVKLGPFGMISMGPVSVLGNRSSSSSLSFNSDAIELPVDDSVAADLIDARAEEIADEISARLVSYFTARS